jgi:hypothetical protein
MNMLQSDPLVTQVLLYFSLGCLVITLVILKLKKQKITSVVDNNLIEFLPEIVLKDISFQGKVQWEIQIHNISQHTIKVLQAKVRGSCLLLDNSKYLIASKDNLIKENYSVASSDMKTIPFIHNFNPEFMPRNIKLGCSLKLQDQDGHIQQCYIPLLFSKKVLFSHHIANKEEDKIAQVA